jgi:hypothetical protein
MATAALNRFGGRKFLRTGHFYATDEGAIVFIQRITDKAHGVYLDGLLPGEWFVDGRYDADRKTNQDINEEVSAHDVRNRHPNWYIQYRLSRR